VPEHGRDHFRFGSGGERQGGRQLPQVVEKDRWQIAGVRVGPERMLGEKLGPCVRVDDAVGLKPAAGPVSPSRRVLARLIVRTKWRLT